MIIITITTIIIIIIIIIIITITITTIIIMIIIIIITIIIIINSLQVFYVLRWLRAAVEGATRARALLQFKIQLVVGQFAVSCSRNALNEQQQACTSRACVCVVCRLLLLHPPAVHECACVCVCRDTLIF